MEGIECSDKRKHSDSGSEEEQTGKRSAVSQEEEEGEPSLRDVLQEIRALRAEFQGLKAEFKRVENKLDEKILKVEKRTGNLEVKVTEHEKRLTELEHNTGADTCAGPSQSEEIEKLKEEIQKQQAYTRRFNLVIKGIPRKPNETNNDIQSTFEQYCLYKLGVSSLNIDKAHRLPDPNLVLVRFVSLKDRDRVWTARGTCKEWIIREDLPKTARETANLLYRCRYAAEKSNLYKSVKIAGGKLVLDGTAYKPENLESLPQPIQPSTLATNKDDSTLVFFTRFSLFSNHRITPFSFKGERYNCMEKFIVVARARFAKNEEMEQRAWKTHYPPELKNLLHIMATDGAESRWETAAEGIVLPALIEKFKQHPLLIKALLETGDRTLGEASPSALWGTGVALGKKDALNVQSWTGKNLLGQMLTKVRDHYRNCGE